MDLIEFKNKTEGKIFVELQGTAVSDFVSLTIPEGAEKGPGQEMREWATEKGILVFLSSLHQIFAKGMYYGCDPEIENTLSTLQGSVTGLVTNLQTLAGTVDTIDGRVDDLEDWTAEKATTIANNVTNISTLTSQVAALQTQVNALDPNASGDTNPIQDAIDARLAALLGFDNKEDENDSQYTWDNSTEGTLVNTIRTLQTAVSTLSTDVALKANQLDFNTLAAKVGAGQTLPWWTAAEDDPHDTIVTVVNEVKNSVQTLRTDITQIPHFTIRVVDSLPVNSNENPISKSTIFLVRKQEQSSGEGEQSGEGGQSGEGEQQSNSNSNNREMFEEYIWVNKNEATAGADADWGWERLGSQFFNIESYVDQDYLDSIATDLQSQITSIANQVSNSLDARITANTNSIASLQTQTANLATELHTLIENGVFKLTGSSIYTNNTKTTFIADDIASLQSGKLDASAIQWAVIGGQTGQQSQSGE